MLADAHGQFFQLFAPRGLHLALPRLQIELATLQRLGVQRRGNVVKQRELRVQALGDLRSLVDRGQRARRGILDGNQDSPDRLHGASVAQVRASLHPENYGCRCRCTPTLALWRADFADSSRNTRSSGGLFHQQVSGAAQPDDLLG